ncbi:hypothetical protein [Pleurocapsa sp. PCC 7319]|uniref:hypothetical protein n=1 Tax=Pleurocapsa sp. PCC 7319 TaxID=118161 RepID=UPI00034D7FFD|nr:hypothetical protein [Pleurocapsa sp. PCC 7319]
MNLSFKDLKFMLEAINHLLSQYNGRLAQIEDQEEYEDEASDLGNDCMFLESLKSEIEQNLNRGEQISLSVSSKTESPKTLESLTESILQLSINERLLLVEAITQSIRKETNLIAS